MTKLRHYRQATGQKLREVAEKIGVTPATVHDTEVRGIRTVKTAKRYAAVFGCDWKDLLD